MGHTVVKPPPIALDVFQICVFDAKIGYEIAYASISLLYGKLFTALSVNVGLYPDSPRRRCGVRFNYLSILPQSGLHLYNNQDDCSGCYCLLPGHFRFPRHPDLLYRICEGKVRFSPMR